MQRVVDWRTGEVSTTEAIGPGFPTVRDGHAVTYARRTSSVVDVTDGSVIVTADKNEFLMMSPDGRYALGQTYDFKDPQARLVDLSTGTAVPLDIKGNGLGWSPDDTVFTLNGSELTTCPADTGACTTTTVRLAVVPGSDGDGSDESFDDDLRLGGATYES